MTNRAKYKQRQDDYVRSIFESDAHEALRLSLMHKRSRTVARYWPKLHKELDDEWWQLFEQHAMENATEFCDDAFADGLRFSSWVAAKRKLGKDALQELRAAQRAKAFQQLTSLLRRK